MPSRPSRKLSKPALRAPAPVLAPAVPRPPAPAPAPRRWHHPSTWLPVLGFLMLLAGAWALLTRTPKSDEPVYVTNPAFPTIVVDAGHGGGDSGARNCGLCEKELTLDTALRLERHLRRLGFPVVLTRRDDRFLPLPVRANIANQIPHALFVSIHFNDNTTASGDGIETFYAVQKGDFAEPGFDPPAVLETTGPSALEPPPADQGAAFAQTVQATIVARLGVTDRGAKPRQLAVVRRTRCPAVLVEGGFLNNPAEARNLALPAYRENLAAAIAEGIAAYQTARTTPQPEPRVVQR